MGNRPSKKMNSTLLRPTLLLSCIQRPMNCNNKSNENNNTDIHEEPPSTPPPTGLKRKYDWTEHQDAPLLCRRMLPFPSCEGEFHIPQQW